jgi:hypothetical protein
MRYTLEQAIAAFEADADSELAAAARAAVAAGTAEWVYDPQVDDAFGLVKPGTNRAMIVVYAPRPDTIGRERWDFETDGSL